MRMHCAQLPLPLRRWHFGPELAILSLGMEKIRTRLTDTKHAPDEDLSEALECIRKFHGDDLGSFFDSLRKRENDPEWAGFNDPRDLLSLEALSRASQR